MDDEPKLLAGCKLPPPPTETLLREHKQATIPETRALLTFYSGLCIILLFLFSLLHRSSICHKPLFMFSSLFLSTLQENHSFIKNSYLHPNFSAKFLIGSIRRFAGMKSTCRSRSENKNAYKVANITTNPLSNWETCMQWILIENLVTSVQVWFRNECNCLDNMLIFVKIFVFLEKPHHLNLFFSLSFTCILRKIISNYKHIPHHHKSNNFPVRSSSSQEMFAKTKKAPPTHCSLSTGCREKAIRVWS